MQAPAASPSEGAQEPAATAPAATTQESTTPQADAAPSADAAQAAADAVPKSPQRLMRAALSQVPVGEISAIREMGASGDPSFIPVLLEFARFQFRLDPLVGTVTYQSLEQILEAYQGPQPIWEDRWWNWWLEWLGEHPEVSGPPGYAAFKGELYSRFFNEEVGSFFYEGVKTAIRLEEVAPRAYTLRLTARQGLLAPLRSTIQVNVNNGPPTPPFRTVSADPTSPSIPFDEGPPEPVEPDEPQEPDDSEEP